MLSTRIKFLLALWLVGEALLFLLIVHLVGVGGAFLLGIATSLLGMALLKRAGKSALQTMRGRLNPSVGAPSGALLDDTLATLGAIALLVPGFLSDVVGLALALPLVRDRIVGFVGRRGGFRTPSPGTPRPKHGPSVIDLEPDQWRPADPAPRAMPRP